MYAITGVTGKVGGELARNLLAAGQRVRAIVRNASKDEEWAALGCEVALANMEDSLALADAFAGATATFILPPPEFDPEPGYPEARAVIDGVVEALTKARPARGFVDVLARRIAPFDRRPIAAAKNLINQVSLPSVDRLLDALNAFQTALTWPEKQQRIEALLERGLQRDSDFENRWSALARHAPRDVVTMWRCAALPVAHYRNLRAVIPTPADFRQNDVPIRELATAVQIAIAPTSGSA
jgi:hypothetical protein